MNDFFFPILSPYNRALLHVHSGKILPNLNRTFSRSPHIDAQGQALLLDVRHILGTDRGVDQRDGREDRRSGRQFLKGRLFLLLHNRLLRLLPGDRSSSVHSIRADS